MEQESPTTDKNYWESCIFLRNLPLGISDNQIASWVFETLRHQPTRVAYAPETSNKADPSSGGSYLIELTPKTVSSAFGNQGHQVEHTFSIRLKCEEVRSEQFAKSCFSDGSSLSTTPNTQETKEEQETKSSSSSLVDRCLLIEQVSDATVGFTTSNDSIVQLFQGCLGAKVKQTKTLDRRRRKTDNPKIIVEFEAEDSISCIMRVYNDDSFSLSIPVKLQACNKRAGDFAKKCLSTANRLTNDRVGEKKEMNQSNGQKEKGKEHQNNRKAGGKLQANNISDDMPKVSNGKRDSNGTNSGEKIVSTNSDGWNKTTRSAMADSEPTPDAGREPPAPADTAKRKEGRGGHVQRLENALKEKIKLLDEEKKKWFAFKAKYDRKVSEKAHMIYLLRKDLKERDVSEMTATIESLTKELKEKDERLSKEKKSWLESKTRHDRKMSEKALTIEKMRKEIGEKDEAIAKKLKDMDVRLAKEKKAWLESKTRLDRKMSEKALTIEKMRKEIEEKDEALAMVPKEKDERFAKEKKAWLEKKTIHYQKMSEKALTIKKMSKEVQEKDEAIKKMRKELQEKDEALAQEKKTNLEVMAKLDGKVSEQASTIDKLRKELKEKEYVLAGASKTETELRSQLWNIKSNLEKEKDALRQQLDEVTRRLEQRPEPAKNLQQYANKIRQEHNNKLKKELIRTQEKVKKLGTKLNNPTGPKVKEAPEAPSLMDWVSSSPEPNKKTSDNDAAPTNSPVKETGSRESEVAALVDFESAVFAGAPPTFHGAEAEEGVDYHAKKNKSIQQTQDPCPQIPKRDDETERRRQDEWEVVSSMYMEDEIRKSENGNSIVRRLLFPVDTSNSKSMAVDLTVDMPNDYPTSSASVLAVNASLTPDQEPASPISRKIVMNALPRLVANCRWEAKSNPGQEAVLTILTSANTWIQNDWKDILDKELKATAEAASNTSTKGQTGSQKSGGLVIGRFLLESHHITDPAKVKLVKSLASQYDLGCCIKTGCPGLVLLEGLNENCKACTSELMKNRVKQRAKTMNSKKGLDTATFALRGAVNSTVGSGAELETHRILSSQFEELDKTKMPEFQQKCQELGLQKFVPTVK